VTGSSIPATKAALNRGRKRLREIANEPENNVAPALAETDRVLPAKYVDRFNARDFDAVRDMLAEEVRLELVNRTRMNGKREVGRYFHNYSDADDWHFVPGLIDGRPALLVHDPHDPSTPLQYFILLEWTGNKLINIRDFRHVRYAIEGAEIVAVA
jgi:RNA polymerase sigma-70 factor (ECF subfamily)